MTFAARPILWLLVFLPILYGFAVYDERSRAKRQGRFAKEKLWPTLAPTSISGARLKKARIWIVAVAFIIIAAARPQWGTHEETLHISGLDIIVALDVSNSMEAEDVVPSRLKKAKHFLKALMDRLSGDRVGVVSFAGSSYVACPLTTDLEYVLETVQDLTPQSIQNQGTDIGAALETARGSLERGAESTHAPVSGPASKAIILISDGEDHEGNIAEAAQKLKNSGIRLFAFGIGTQKGAPIPMRDLNGNLTGYKKDHRGQAVLTSFNPDTLIQMASAAGGKYWNISPEEGEAEELLQELGVLNRSEFSERRFVVREERYQFPLALAVLLLIWEMSIPVRKVLLILCASVMLGSESPSQAAELTPYFENEKGIEALKNGKVDEAEKRFGSAQAIDPSRPELQYNLGITDLEQEKWDQAIDKFRESAWGAVNRGDQKLLAKSLYNLGIAEAKKGDFKSAARSYAEAVRQASGSKDEKLESDARKNLELLNQEKQKQKQQKQEQQQQNSKDQQQSEQQKQDQQQKKQDKDQEKQKDQREKQKAKKNEEKDKDQAQKDPHYQETPKQRDFQSEKLSKEDAERVMQELKNRERDVQARLGKKNDLHRSYQKDW